MTDEQFESMVWHLFQHCTWVPAKDRNECALETIMASSLKLSRRHHWNYRGATPDAIEASSLKLSRRHLWNYRGATPETIEASSLKLSRRHPQTIEASSLKLSRRHPRNHRGVIFETIEASSLKLLRRHLWNYRGVIFETIEASSLKLSQCRSDHSVICTSQWFSPNHYYPLRVGNFWIFDIF